MCRALLVALAIAVVSMMSAGPLLADPPRTSGDLWIFPADEITVGGVKIRPVNDPKFVGMSVMRMCETDYGTWLLGSHTGYFKPKEQAWRACSNNSNEARNKDHKPWLRSLYPMSTFPARNLPCPASRSQSSF